MTAGVAGRRVLVAGASSGVGRALALRLVKSGADTVLVGRNEQRLRQVRDDAGGGQVLLADLRDPDASAALRAALGDQPLDAVVSTVGVAPLAFLADTTPEQWLDALQTNVVGSALLLQVVVPLMSAGGCLMALSSESVGQGRPGLGAYAASKAALEELLRTWRNERPGLRFTTVVIGGTMPTAFADGFDQEVSQKAVTDWVGRGLIQEALMSTDDVAELLLGVLSEAMAFPGVSLDRVELRSPSPVAGSTAHLVHEPPRSQE
jgi:NAD(P)-dependent dehydrogenase (short-subunit alcohol dehydrogenase family)